MEGNETDNDYTERFAFWNPNGQYQYEDQEDLEDFTSRVPDDILSDDIVNEMMEGQSLFDGLQFQDFNQEPLLNESPTVSDTVGNKSIRELLQMPTKVQSDHHLNSFVCKKEVTIEQQQQQQNLSQPIQFITNQSISQTSPNLQALLMSSNQTNSQQVVQQNFQPIVYGKVVSTTPHQPFITSSPQFITPESSPPSNYGSPQQSVLVTSSPQARDDVNRTQNVIVVPVHKFPIERVTSTTPKTPKTSNNKRSNHNTIEKRYRASINQRITQLHEFLEGGKGKMAKAAVLEKAYQRLKSLTHENKQKDRIIKFLRTALSQAKGQVDAHTVATHDIMCDDDVSMVHDVIPSPPNSIGPDSPSTSVDGVIRSNYIPKTSLKRATPAEMTSQTRFIMCIFTLLVVVFNPINKFAAGFGNTSSGDVTHVGREILRAHNDVTGSWWQWLGAKCLAYLINIGVGLLVALHLLVWKEPVTMVKSDAHFKYCELRMRANEEMRKGNHRRSADYLHDCLMMLGRPIPANHFDKICLLLWNIIRYVITAFRFNNIARLFISDVTSYQHSARFAAQIYHRLNQLDLTGKIKESRLDGINFTLSSINLCEAAGYQLTPPDVAVRIYATAAIRVKRHFPPFLKWLSQYLLKKSEKILNRYSRDCDEELNWLRKESAHQFLINSERYHDNDDDDDHSLTTEVRFTSISDRDDPVSHAAFYFRKQLMQRALNALNKPTAVERSESFHLLQLLADCDQDELVEDENESRFWLSVATAAAYYSLGDSKTAMTSSLDIDIPFDDERNELRGATKWSFVAHRDALQLVDGDDDVITHEELFDVCSRASKLLHGNLLNLRNNKNSISMAFRLIACEWILKSRTLLWEQMCCYGDVTRTAPLRQIIAFENDVTMLKTIVYNQPELKSRVFIYEAILMMMSGSNPVATEKLLHRILNRRRHKNEAVLGDYERARAIMMTCRHLPPIMLTSPTQPSGMLREALRIMQRHGDQRSSDVIINLLKRVGDEVKKCL